MMPTLFIAHGAPLLAIEDNEYTQFLNGNLDENASELVSLCEIRFKSNAKLRFQITADCNDPFESGYTY